MMHTSAEAAPCSPEVGVNVQVKEKEEEEESLKKRNVYEKKQWGKRRRAFSLSSPPLSCDTAFGQQLGLICPAYMVWQESEQCARVLDGGSC